MVSEERRAQLRKSNKTWRDKNPDKVALQNRAHRRKRWLMSLAIEWFFSFPEIPRGARFELERHGRLR